MIKIGITGQEGFIGKHLYNTIGLFPEEFVRIDFRREYFEHSDKLEEFVSSCDVIVHLAALNRHNDAEVIYDTNTTLVKKLISALNSTSSIPHVLYSSSSQEDRENLYGKSKKEGRQMLASWAKKANARFTGLIIPNVFGPFGNPYYNSFIATFCHQLSNDEQPEIAVDGEVKLIYVGDLVKEFLNEIRSQRSLESVVVPHTDERKVSEVLERLRFYKTEYMDLGIIPDLKTLFDVNLFNTFRGYIDIKNYFPVKFKQNIDPRGTFVEIIRLNLGGQVSFSTTVSGIIRGNHYHTRKIERFAVIKGKALIQLRKIGTDEVLNYELDGNEPAYVDMPVWYTHNIKNIGKEELYTIFWINEFFDPNDTDTYFENV